MSNQIFERISIEKHAEYTKSQKAISVLANWDNLVPKFVKVMPRDYKRVLQAIQNALASGLSGDDALNAAFEEKFPRCCKNWGELG
jgi:glutamate synthase (ferredoxin)